MKKSEDAYVPIATLLTFKKLLALTTLAEEVVAAVRASDTQLVEVSEDGLSLRRSPLFPLPSDAEVNARSVYAKGFDQTVDAFEPIRDFFTEKGFNVLSVRLRRFPGASKKFKGSAFVEFVSAEEANKAAETKYTLGEKPILVMLKDAYLAKKRAETKKPSKFVLCLMRLLSLIYPQGCCSC